MSEAFYFTDPEGNGIELYTDRPRTQWGYVNGEIQMATRYLDPNAYLQRHLTQEVLDAAPGQAGRVGHVHLQVGDVATARAFYVDALGFEPTATSYPGALFASAGGYHHHIAMNVWHSAGAGPRAASLGLGDVVGGGARPRRTSTRSPRAFVTRSSRSPMTGERCGSPIRGARRSRSPSPADTTEDLLA